MNIKGIVDCTVKAVNLNEEYNNHVTEDNQKGIVHCFTKEHFSSTLDTLLDELFAQKA